MANIDKALEHLQANVGQELGVSDWVVITQAMIDQFADVTEDHQYIHVDPIKAKQSQFGGTIAHGFLTLSMASKFAGEVLEPTEGLVTTINYGFEKVRFLAPVPSEIKIRGRFVLQSAHRKSDTAIMQNIALTIEIDGNETPALVAEWLTVGVFEN